MRVVKEVAQSRRLSFESCFQVGPVAFSDEVYRERPRCRDSRHWHLRHFALFRYNAWAEGLDGFTVPQPHLEEGTTYYPLRPTKLDKIKKLHAEVHAGAVAAPQRQVC